MPVVMFPTSRNKFYEYENSRMIHAIAHKIEARQLQVFCVDSVDSESWYNRGIHPHERVMRHIAYESYILYEVLPLVRGLNGAGQICTTGCSFGGYHALNLALRHPDVVSACVPMSGSYDIKSFLDGYYDHNGYFNNPIDYLPNLNDDSLLSRIRQMKIVLGTADWDMCLDANVKMSGMLHAKSIPHWLDIYGDNSKHDWPLWQRMAQKYF